MKRRIERYLKSSNLIRYSYGTYAIIRICIDAYHKANSKFEAPIDPFELLYIDPSTIVNMWDTNPESIEERGRNQNRISQARYYVWEGDWDKKGFEFNKYDLHQSFCDHFNNGAEWQSTTFYNRILEKISRYGDWKGCTTEAELLSRMKDIDSLYREINNNGYREISEINKDPISNSVMYPSELYEVTICIGRNGEYIFFEGRHRLSIAKLLGIDKIPVRVIARHKEWHKTRDRLLNNYKTINDSTPNSPISSV